MKEYIDKNCKFEKVAGDKYCAAACEYGCIINGYHRNKQAQIIKCLRGFDPEGCKPKMFFDCSMKMIKAEIVAGFFIEQYQESTYNIMSQNNREYLCQIIDQVQLQSSWRVCGGIAVVEHEGCLFFYQAIKMEVK